MFLRTSRSIIAILTLHSAVAPAQQLSRENPTSGILAGDVRRNDASATPVMAAEVAIPALGLRTTTDTLGTFVLRDIPVGDHVVEVRALGHAPLTLSISWKTAERLTHHFRLMPVPPPLPPMLPAIDVRASRLRGFEERRALGRGHFLTEDLFAQNATKRVADVLARVPGLRIIRGNSGAAYVINSRGSITLRGANPTCYVHVYVDDALMFNSAAERFRSNVTREPQGLYDVNTLTSAEIIGVEYYSGGASIPAQYNRTGSACGVLLIWTRR